MTATNRQRAFVAKVFADADRELAAAVAAHSRERDTFEGNAAAIRAAARMAFCARVVGVLEGRAREKLDLLERALAELHDLQAASVRWAELAGEWSTIYQHARGPRADESETW